MKMKWFSSYLIFVIVLCFFGCGAFYNECIYVKKDDFISKYNMVRKIVQEEALNNGWNNISPENSVVKPSKYNNWEGEILYILKTNAGKDTLRVKFNLQNNEIRISISGAGLQANAPSAKKAISEKLQKLFKGSVRIES